MEGADRRILRNSIWMYVRMLFIMVISLYTSRVVLEILGESDFGIYALVGGIVSIFTVISGTLNSSVQRFLNIGLGKGDKELTRGYFSQSLTIYLVAFALFLVLSQTLGLWFVSSMLNLPQGRECAAFWVYETAVVSVLFAVIQIPFSGAVIAHEKMNVFALCGIYDVCARLVAVVSLKLYGSADNLILYAVIICVIQISISLFYVLYSLSKFDECRLRLRWERSKVREILSFISYSLFGNAALTLSQQGVNVIINLFFGTVANAAKGIATQVNVAVIRLEECINTPIKPQVVQSYANGDMERMLMLFEKNARYTLFAMLLLCTPLICETEYILNLWLPDVPEYAAGFTRIVLLEALVAVASYSAATVITAVGRLERMEFRGRFITLSVLPLSYMALKLYGTDNPMMPLVPALLSLLAQIAYTLYVIYDLKRRIDLDMRRYCREVLLPLLKGALLLLVICGAELLLLPNSFLRLAVVGISVVVILALLLKEDLKMLIKGIM